MDDEIILVKPSIEHKKQAINFIEEVEKVDMDSVTYILHKVICEEN